jgi:hypothetical protein
VKARLLILAAALLLFFCLLFTAVAVASLPGHYPAVEPVAGSDYRSFELDPNSCWFFYYQRSEGVTMAPAAEVADWYRRDDWDELSSQASEHTEWSTSFRLSDRLIGYRGAALWPAADGTMHLTTFWSVRLIIPGSCR